MLSSLHSGQNIPRAPKNTRGSPCSVSRIGSDDLPYTESLAYQDWAPYSYLDGFHGDESTGGSNNERALLKHDGGSKVLDVLLPKGCVTGACAMQTKSALITPVDSATLKFKCGFPLWPLGPLCARAHASNSELRLCAMYVGVSERAPAMSWCRENTCACLQNEVWQRL